MQTRSLLCIYHDLNWAYAPRLQKQFCLKNIVNNRLKVKTLSQCSFRKRKLKEL